MSGTEPEIRPLLPADHDAWLPLWREYQAFYEVELGEAVEAATWGRFHDPAEPMHALGAWCGRELTGIAHYIFHRSCWSVGLSCYLQDLYTRPATRGRGVGSALVRAVAEAAARAGCAQVHWLTHESNARARRLYDRLAERPGFIQYRLPLSGGR